MRMPLVCCGMNACPQDQNQRHTQTDIVIAIDAAAACGCA